MTRAILIGAAGRMGAAVAAASANRVEIVAGVDIHKAARDFPIYRSINEVAEPADVIIDFSRPGQVQRILDYAVKHRLPLVSATTGYTNEEESLITDASARLAIVRSSNFATGVNTLRNIVAHAARLMPNVDIEIVESHHRDKVDSPSGTALSLALEIEKARERAIPFKFGRLPSDAKREPGEIAIHSVRGGTGAGEHSVLFLLDGEVIEIRHQSFSRDIFAIGALNAANWIVGRGPGLYNVDDMV